MNSIDYFRSLEAKQSSLEKDNEFPVVEAAPEKPIDPRCKVCFKMISDTEFFRICSVCVRKVCDDCSASYNSKDEAEVTDLFLNCLYRRNPNGSF